MGPRWEQWDPDGINGTQMGAMGPKWVQWDPNGCSGTQMEAMEPKWDNGTQLGQWDPKGSNGTQMEAMGPKWDNGTQMGAVGPNWAQWDPTTWNPNISPRRWPAAPPPHRNTPDPRPPPTP